MLKDLSLQISLIFLFLLHTLFLFSPANPALHFLWPLPFLIAGLRNGPLYAGGLGLLSSILMLLFRGEPLIHAIIYWLPPTVLSFFFLQKREEKGKTHWYPASYMVRWLLILGLLMSGVAFFMTQEKEIADVLQTKAPSHGIEAIINIFLRYTPGIIGAFFILQMAALLCLAQALLVRLGIKRRPSPPLHKISSYPPFLWSFAACLLGWQFSPIFGNLALCFFAYFILCGLSVVHAFFKDSEKRIGQLSLFYIISVLFSWPLLVVGVLGIFRPWIRLKKID